MSNPIVPIAKLCVRKELKGRVGGGGGGGTNESVDLNRACPYQQSKKCLKQCI